MRSTPSSTACGEVIDRVEAGSAHQAVLTISTRRGAWLLAMEDSWTAAEHLNRLLLFPTEPHAPPQRCFRVDPAPTSAS